MINLLPPDVKEDMRYARRNTILRKWLASSLVGFAGVLLIIASGVWFIDQSTKSQQRQVDQARQQLQDQKLQETQKRVSEISDSVKLVADVLSRQILFSKLFEQIGSVMPANTTLESLNISTIEGGISLSARAVDYQSATQVQVNLANPENKIFQNADIQNISCQNDPESENPYPCSVSIRALFAKDNTFQYSTDSEKSNE